MSCPWLVTFRGSDPPSILGNVMNIEAYVAGLDADLVRLKTEKAEFVERRERMWSRWGTEPFVEFTGQRIAEFDRQLDELTHLAAAVRAGRRFSTLPSD
jgi:hypothetical protein